MLLQKIANEFSFKDVPIDQVQEILIQDKGSIRNFVGAFQCSEDQLTAVKYIGVQRDDPAFKALQPKNVNPESNAAPLILSEKESPYQLDKDFIEKQLNTENILNSLNLNQVVSYS